MFLAFNGFLVDVFLGEGVAVLDDLEDALLVGPFEEVLCEAGVLFAGAAQEDEAEVVFLAPGPGAGRAIGDADAAADAEVGVALNLAVHDLEGADRPLLAVFDALFTADTAVGVVLGLGHSDDAEVIHADLGAVIGAAGEGDFHVQVVGVDELVHLAGKVGGVIAAEGTEALAGAGDDVSGAGCGIAALVLLLVNAGRIDNELELLVDGVHVLHFDAGDLNALAVGDENGAVSVFFGDLRDADHGFRVDHAAGNTHTGSCLSAYFGVAEGILLQFFKIYIKSHMKSSLAVLRHPSPDQIPVRFIPGDPVPIFRVPVESSQAIIPGSSPNGSKKNREIRPWWYMTQFA